MDRPDFRRRISGYNYHVIILIIVIMIIVIIVKIKILPELLSKLCFSANCPFLGQSFSLGHYPPIYQSPKGVYLLNIVIFQPSQINYLPRPSALANN